MALPRPPSLKWPRFDNQPKPGAPADPLFRSLAICVAGMALLLLIDIASEPRGHIGQDRAIEAALSTSSEALGSVTQSEEMADETSAAERRERAQSAAFFLEQANLAWRRGSDATPETIKAEIGASGVLAFFGKLWVLGWLLLPFGALAARISCPTDEDRHPRWALVFGADALGASGGLIALALALYALGIGAPFVLAPLVSAIVVLNAWLLRKHARLDRAAALLRLAPVLVILTVGLIVAREMLLHLGTLP
tara:strand:+ start:368 stop:1123 length:756 start_codon:yes stop_codon:yes gene_type:complete